MNWDFCRISAHLMLVYVCVLGVYVCVCVCVHVCACVCVRSKAGKAFMTASDLVLLFTHYLPV